MEARLLRQLAQGLIAHTQLEDAIMASHIREQEGDQEQRRAKSREAQKEGKRPAETAATLGASKQTKQAKSSASHQERIEQRDEGKATKGAKRSRNKPRPGNRTADPKRTERSR